jgi:deoxyribodipyrimidine photo-lyase
MSPYLHFGQISPREIAARILGADSPSEAKEAFLEELIVRRELSMNFVYYNPLYRSYQSLPGWAQETLNDHRSDDRERIYDLNALEQGRTEDPYWNAAMREMRVTGKMHNYMRMYWGKRLIEWHEDPEDAFDRTLILNNKYFLDGRDANSFAGVAWCFGKHDRPWPERKVFGKVRYMNAAGLKRKFDIEEYVRWTEALSAEESHSDTGSISKEEV